MVEFLLGFFLGSFSLLGYLIWRMLNSDGWDKSNVTNALRLLSHVAIHPEDFGKMWYVDETGKATFRPFWYIEYDELESVVDTRPNRD